MSCRRCKGKLNEVTLSKALEVTKGKTLKSLITGSGEQKLPDAYKQYHIRSFIGNRSLFLEHDLNKSRLKHGPRLKRFFIDPLHPTGLLNIPWFIYNIISSNLFHMNYTEYCPTCDSKFRKGEHPPEECEYNIEYFHILDDILSGEFSKRKRMYQQFADENRVKGIKSAYNDLFNRGVYKEMFLDLMSVLFSIFFWYGVIITIHRPLIGHFVGVQKLFEQYEWFLPDSRWLLPDSSLQ